jgi:hypothetical protein
VRHVAPLALPLCSGKHLRFTLLCVLCVDCGIRFIVVEENRSAKRDH